jgi:prepilin-type N-terminal cleavage/methylation domain-containing protein
MTLVELMIVVVVIGILAAIAVVGYRKYIASARVSEATAMLAEFAAKEQLYYLENGLFAEAHQAAPVYPSGGEGPGDFWPHDPNQQWDSAREAFSGTTDNPTMPASWRVLGMRPRWNQFFCTYMAGAGAAGGIPDAKYPIGSKLFRGTPGVPWFYALAACNLRGTAGWPTGVTVLGLTHESPQIIRFDE